MSAIKLAGPREFKIWAITALFSGIVACSTPPSSVTSPTETVTQGLETHAQSLLIDQEFELAATEYAMLARTSSDPVQAAHFSLIEAEILFAHGLHEKAIDRTNKLPTAMPTTELQSRRELLQSAADLYSQQANKALLSLPDPRLIADPSLLIRYHDLRYQAGAALDESAMMFNSLITLNQLENSTNQELRNNQIWELLNTRDGLTLEQLNNNASTTTHQGWLSLLTVLHGIRDQGLDQRSSIATWQQHYHDHPATDLLASTDDINSLLSAGSPEGSISLVGSETIALLLPFDDRLSKISSAIRDGLLSALFENNSNREIRIYNIGRNPANALPLYQKAVADGAQLVIGPLRRSALENLVKYGELTVPLLALNYLPAGGAENLIQFGLSPEDEARDAVSYMVQAGLSTAAMILPDTEAGARSGEAFQQQLERWGGKVVATQILDSTKNDYRKELSALLLINDSLNRRRSIQSELDTSLVFETRTRNDLDAIFAPVPPSIGRVLKPQLDFHNAGDTPLLASSTLYSGTPEPEPNSDLNGTLFNDMPWIIDRNRSTESSLRSAADKLKLNQGPLARFYALGIDTYRIIEKLGPLLEHNEYSINGATGRLSLDNDRRIRRQLAWAVFESGTAKPIAFEYTPFDPPPAPILFLEPEPFTGLPPHATDE